MQVHVKKITSKAAYTVVVCQCLEKVRKDCDLMQFNASPSRRIPLIDAYRNTWKPRKTEVLSDWSKSCERHRISSHLSSHPEPHLILHLIYYILSHLISLGGPEHTHPNQLQPPFTTHDPAWNQNNISYQKLKYNMKESHFKELHIL